MPSATAADHTETARRALEEVCSNRDPEGVTRDYHPDFVDHVNRLAYHGHEGVRRSVALYVELFPDVRFEVDDQVSEGDKVASRWTLRGTHRGREVELRGIVISRFEDGRIIEDWAVNDTMELLRQLGLRRGLALALRQRKKILDSDGPGSASSETPRRSGASRGTGRREPEGTAWQRGKPP
jgi:predicted ester cyclase